jgi:hypothetical protein
MKKNFFISTKHINLRDYKLIITIINYLKLLKFKKKWQTLKKKAVQKEEE